MSREQTYTAVILKKQPFGEADEIITFFTRESGKLRGLAKSVKLSKSKLQNSLQSLFVVQISLAGKGHLPKIISAEPQKVFLGVREDLEALKCAFYASELVLKFTPDAQKDEGLFGLLAGFLEFLELFPESREAALAKLKVDFLQLEGFSAGAHRDLAKRPDLLKLCQKLEVTAFNDLPALDLKGLGPLQDFLSEFIVYNLERQLKSEQFLKGVL